MKYKDPITGEFKSIGVKAIGQQALNSNSNSTENTYSCDYINKLNSKNDYISDVIINYDGIEFNHNSETFQQVVEANGFVNIYLVLAVTKNLTINSNVTIGHIPAQILTNKYIALNTVADTLKANCFITPTGEIRFNANGSLPVNSEIIINVNYYL